MNLLVVAATKFEIAPFLKENPNADVFITGVGIPATIFHLTKKLLENKYDLVIQAGIAGAFGHHLNLGDVVAVEKDTFGDLGIDESGNFQTLFEKELAGKNDFPFHDGWLINHTSSFNKQGLPQAKAITVNLVTGDSVRNKWTEEKFSADIESMEGAAFHYVCLQQKIDFLQLRSISNKVGERNKMKWETAKAIKNLNEELFKTIKNLSI